jgi:hypothetical protein
LDPIKTPDGWMKNDKAAGTRSGLGGGRLVAKASNFLTGKLNLPPSPPKKDTYLGTLEVEL